MCRPPSRLPVCCAVPSIAEALRFMCHLLLHSVQHSSWSRLRLACQSLPAVLLQHHSHPSSRPHSCRAAPRRWQCSNSGCLQTYGRHSNSIDVTKKVCGACRAPLTFLGRFRPDGTPAKQRAASPNKYAQFVKENHADGERHVPCDAATWQLCRCCPHCRCTHTRLRHVGVSPAWWCVGVWRAIADTAPALPWHVPTGPAHLLCPRSEGAAAGGHGQKEIG